MESSGTAAFHIVDDEGIVDESCFTNDQATRDVATAEPEPSANHVDAGSNSTVDEIETNNNLHNNTFLNGTMMIGGDPTTILSSKGRENGSVISAMTDLNSLEGPTLPSLLGEEETSSQRSCGDQRNTRSCVDQNNNDNGIPKQVILPKEDSVLVFASNNDDDVDSNVNYLSPTAPSDTYSSPISDSGGTDLHHHQPEHPIGPIDASKSNAHHIREFSDQSINDATATTAPSTLISQQQRVDAFTPSTTLPSSGDAIVQPTEEEVVDDDKYDENNIALDEYIRSPEVQNAIVERSPGGRYVRFLEKLGSGASKDVYRAYDTQEGIEVAWNVVNLSGVPKSERNRIVNEVRLLERLHHQNIISFHGSWVNRERQEVNFVTEILSSGTLKSFINKVQVIRWKIAKRWALQILKGLEYLHSQDPPVIHRDLKCENIFINGTSGDLRIGDLGLSTVHRNGKVLSVLGTPEFMAPDMYEEDSYDEKVDVYAFGMCLLEIFTKEIPYSECSNPAQIYKKVTAGEPPEVLSRLQSRHARDFVLLCLGHRDENGKYIRPTVSELLQHPFLEKRANDDDEVVVDLPPRQAQQDSVPEPTAGGTPLAKRRVSTHSSQTLHHQNNSSNTEHIHSRDSSFIGESIPISPNDTTPKQSRNNSLKPVVASSPPEDDEDDGDRFEEMQESEINMRKVKVLMGRGQELKEDDEIPSTGTSNVGSISAPQTTASAVETTTSIYAEPSPPQTQSTTTQTIIQNAAENSNESSSLFNYIVSAAVVENENPNVRPYDDDILQLIVTLPVDGQSNYVLFDFHLIEDDPIQVAKEMVKELGIPQGAVLEISETISSIARNARMKQDKYTAKLHSVQSVPIATLPVTYPMPTQDKSHQQTVQQETIHYSHDQLQHIAIATGGQTNAHPQQETQYNPIIQTTSAQQHEQGNMTQKTALQSELPNISGVALGASVVQRQEQYVHPIAHQSVVNNGQIFQAHDKNVSGAAGSHQIQNIILTNSSQVPAQNLSSASTLPDVQTSLPQSNLQQTYPSVPQQPPAVQPDSNQHPTSEQHPVTQRPLAHSHSQNIQHAVALSGNASEMLGSIAAPIHSGRDLKPVDGRPPIQNRQRSGGSDKSSDNDKVENIADTLPTHTHQVNTLDASTAQQIQHQLPQGAMSINPIPQPIMDASVSTVPSNTIQSHLPPHPTTTLQPGLTPQAPIPIFVSHTQPSQMGRDEAQIGETSQLVGIAPCTISTETIATSDVLNSNVIEPEGDSDEDDDVDIAEELRKLDEDFQKNLERAKKVFTNRMDNLQRSQIEREAQHLKTLEKHEKERAEFEKRLALEAEQQQRRIEQLQREWDKKRETVAIQKKKYRDASTTSTSEPSSEISQGHLRSVSATSSNFSLSPAMSVHKQQNEHNVENGHIDR